MANAVNISEVSDPETYETPKLMDDEVMVLMCKIGDRDLFFEVSSERQKLHPFVLINVTARNEQNVASNQ